MALILRTKEKEIFIMGASAQNTTPSNQEVKRRTSFVSSIDGQADILVNAACVARFLAELAPAMIPVGTNSGLSEDGCHGLGMILDALGNTIDEALKLVGCTPSATTM